MYLSLQALVLAFFAVTGAANPLVLDLLGRSIPYEQAHTPIKRGHPSLDLNVTDADGNDISHLVPVHHRIVSISGKPIRSRSPDVNRIGKRKSTTTVTRPIRCTGNSSTEQPFSQSMCTYDGSWPMTWICIWGNPDVGPDGSEKGACLPNEVCQESEMENGLSSAYCTTTEDDMEDMDTDYEAEVAEANALPSDVDGSSSDSASINSADDYEDAGNEAQTAATAVWVQAPAEGNTTITAGISASSVCIDAEDGNGNSLASQCASDNFAVNLKGVPVDTAGLKATAFALQTAGLLILLVLVP